jgi:hypothetical protein
MVTEPEIITRYKKEDKKQRDMFLKSLKILQGLKSKYYA